MKIALIGYGYWGPNIAKNLKRTKKADLVAIFRHCANEVIDRAIAVSGREIVNHK